jgi:membrane peptidoglycan carboxypeptidase
MSWGYGISITPMQTLMFYNAVANNGVMVKPRFVKELRRQDKNLFVLLWCALYDIVNNYKLLKTNKV